MTDEQAPSGSALARGVLADLRPQDFGRGNPSNVSNPLVEPLWAGLRVLAAIDAGGVAMVDEDGDPIDGFDAIVEALSGSSTGQRARDRRVHHQAGDADVRLGRGLARRAALLDGVDGRAPAQPRDRHGQAQGGRATRTPPSTRPTRSPSSPRTCCGSTTTSLLDIPLLERRRLLEGVLVESDVVRIGAFVRPPIQHWVTSWRAQGFEGLTFKAANSRYLPGRPEPRMGHQRDAAPLRVVRLASCPRPR